MLLLLIVVVTVVAAAVVAITAFITSCVLRTVFYNTLLKKRQREGKNWRENEEEDVSRYWITLQEKRGYWKLKEEAINRTLWRTHFGRGYGPFVRYQNEWVVVAAAAAFVVVVVVVVVVAAAAAVAVVIIVVVLLIKITCFLCNTLYRLNM